jgi:hypothetical protein
MSDNFFEWFDENHQVNVGYGHIRGQWKRLTIIKGGSSTRKIEEVEVPWKAVPEGILNNARQEILNEKK